MNKLPPRSFIVVIIAVLLCYSTTSGWRWHIHDTQQMGQQESSTLFPVPCKWIKLSEGDFNTCISPQRLSLCSVFINNYAFTGPETICSYLNKQKYNFPTWTWPYFTSFHSANAPHFQEASGAADKLLAVSLWLILSRNKQASSDRSFWGWWGLETAIKMIYFHLVCFLKMI